MSEEEEEEEEGSASSIDRQLISKTEKKSVPQIVSPRRTQHPGHPSPPSRGEYREMAEWGWWKWMQLRRVVSVKLGAIFRG